MPFIPEDALLFSVPRAVRDIIADIEAGRTEPDDLRKQLDYIRTHVERDLVAKGLKRAKENGR